MPAGRPSSYPLTGGALGGGIANASGSTLSIANSTFIGNVALGGSTNAGLGGTALGGGIENNQSAMLTMTDSALAANQAVGGTGGSGFAGGFGSGGGLDISKSSTATIANSVFSQNEALGGAGGSGASGGNGLGGGIGVGFYTLVSLADTSVLTIAGTTLDDNVAQGGAGGNSANGGNGFGGGVAIEAGSTATANGSTITHNQAIAGTGAPWVITARASVAAFTALGRSPPPLRRSSRRIMRPRAVTTSSLDGSGANAGPRRKKRLVGARRQSEHSPGRSRPAPGFRDENGASVIRSKGG